MPDRVLRDELLTSERYWSVSPEARNLFVSLVLSADDTGRYTASNFALRTKCMAGTVSAERTDKLLLELVDVDLVRMYDEGRHLFIPRYRQRLRYVYSRYPEPPQEINDLTKKKTVLRLSQVSPKSAEVKRSEVNLNTLAQTAFARLWSAYPKKRGKGHAEKAFARIRPDDGLLATMLEAIDRTKASADWQQDNGRFIPYPATWLNRRGWEDELQPVAEKKVAW